MVDLLKQLHSDPERIRQIEREKTERLRNEQLQIDRNRERVDEIEREKKQPPPPPPEPPPPKK
jgi:hypothetical protein